MKIAKASPQDVEAAFDLMAVLDAIDRGYYPAEKGSDGEDDPTFFDEDDPEHLARLWRLLKTALDASPGFQGRIILGMAAVIDARNAIVDPDSDTLDLHPRLANAASDAAALRSQNERLREALRLADAAMNHMVDALNAMDACLPEDEDAVAAAFEAVSAALADGEEG